MPFLIAAWPFVRRALPYLAALAAVLLAYQWAYGRGVGHERASWEREASRLRAVAAAEALQRVEAVNRATVADSERNAILARLMAPIQAKVVTYEASPAGRAVCLDDAGRMLAQSAIDAAKAAAPSAPRR